MGVEDPDEILFQGHVVGRMHNGPDGQVTVTLSISYTTQPDLAVVPLSWFAHGLTLAHAPPRQGPVLASSDTDLEAVEGPTLLIEKVLKSGGYKWQFHLNDPDPWPSALHGHDYEKGLVLDLFTGEIFEVLTRQSAGKLKTKSLVRLQGQLRQSSGFEGRF